MQTLNNKYTEAAGGPFFAAKGAAAESVPLSAAARRRGRVRRAQGRGEQALIPGVGRLSACVMHAMLWPRAALRRHLSPILSRLGDKSVMDPCGKKSPLSM